MGERGQIVIPQRIREEMGLQKGEKFMILQDKEHLILKPARMTREDLTALIEKAREHAKKHHLTKKDLANAIKKARAA